MSTRSRVIFGLAMCLWFACGKALACPFCGAPQTTLSERLSKSHLVVAVKWIDVTSDKGNAIGTTRLEVLEPAENVAEKIRFARKDTITLPRAFFAKPGDELLLFGTKSDEMRWDTPLAGSLESYQYLKSAPRPDQPSRDRLRYFLAHLESADSLIAMDAFAEFALAPYDVVESLADQLPRNKLRRWLKDPQTVAHRRGLYGLMLGLCGDQADARFLKELIDTPFDEMTSGRDGMIFGYLLLTGATGLEHIEQSKLRSRDPALADDEMALSRKLNDVSSVVQALEVAWTTGRHGISRERLRESMRHVLVWPEVGGRVVANLALWKDWSAQNQLMKLFEKQSEDRSLQRAIVGYFLAAASATDTSDEANSKTTPKPSTQALQARTNLDKLRTLNPHMVKDVERFFVPKP